MPKATLINPQGQKVVVESGTPEAQNYFGQGYKLMGADGKFPVDQPVGPPPVQAAPGQGGGIIVNGVQQPAKPAPGAGIIQTSETIVKEENNIKDTITNLTNGTASPSSEAARKASEDYLKILDDENKRLEDSRQAQIDAINAQKDRELASLKDTQKREAATQFVGLQRIGGYLGGAASYQGAINNLAQTHRQEISAFEAARAAAINAANSAVNEKQFALAKAKAQEAKDIEKTIEERRQTFFKEALQLIQEQRQQETEDRLASKDRFDQSLKVVDKVAPTFATMLDDFEGTEAEAADFMFKAAKDLGVDPNLLLGEVNRLQEGKKSVELQQVRALANKFIDAGIDDEDTFASAQEKIRTGSASYQRDIMKSELELANAKALLDSRLQSMRLQREKATSSTRGIDDADSSILRVYTDVTGNTVDPKSGTARAIINYTDNILKGKEIIDDGFIGPLLENQMRASDMEQLLRTSFSALDAAQRDEEEIEDTPESVIWQWLGDEGRDYSDEEKVQWIMAAGKDPYDFGY